MHCDIKEPNVMISGDSDWAAPNVVVIDFGLARDFRKGSTGVMGTPGYMPPEAPPIAFDMSSFMMKASS